MNTIMFRFPPNGKARVNKSGNADTIDELKFRFPPSGKARVNARL